MIHPVEMLQPAYTILLFVCDITCNMQFLPFMLDSLVIMQTTSCCNLSEKSHFISLVRLMLKSKSVRMTITYKILNVYLRFREMLRHNSSELIWFTEYIIGHSISSQHCSVDRKNY